MKTLKQQAYAILQARKCMEKELVSMEVSIENMFKIAVLREQLESLLDAVETIRRLEALVDYIGE